MKIDDNFFYFTFTKTTSRSDILVEWLLRSSKSAHSFSVRSTSRIKSKIKVVLELQNFCLKT